MPESFLGNRLSFQESMPVTFTPGVPAEGAALAQLNADNHQLLIADASIDDVRVHESLKDESPALVHELQRMEFKLNIVVRLVAQLAAGSQALPAPQLISLASHGLEWFGADAPPLGSSGMLRIFINSALPQPLNISSVVVSERTQDERRVAQLRFSGLSEAVVELLDKLIFRHHRRLVAGARLAHT